MVSRTRLIMIAVLVATVAAVALVAESVIASIVGMLFVYAVWAAIVRFLVSWSRLVGGLAMLVLSLLLLAAGLVTTWVGGFGLVVFAYGNWLSLTSAARLDA